MQPAGRRPPARRRSRPRRPRDRLTWRVTVPATSSRLLLGLEFDLDDATPVCTCAREMRLDWKLSVRRRPAAPVPVAGTSPSEFEDPG